MRNLLLFMVFILLSCLTHAQNTYYWTGGDGANGAVSFTTNSKWNTALDGSGTARTLEDSTDVLIIDGSNIGGATPMTGNIIVKAGSTFMGQLILRNNVNLTLLRMAVGNGSFKIKGDATAADDLQVPAGCTLTSTTLPGLVDSAGNNIIIQPAATGRISGIFSVVSGGCKVSVLNTQSGGALFFESGSVCNVNTKNTVSVSGSISTHFPFGSNSGANYGIVFKIGSTLNYLGGNGIFTSTSAFTPVVFQTGSTLVIQAPIPSSFVTSSNFFSSRFFANVSIASGISVDADNHLSMQNLTLGNGATLHLKSSGTFPVSGNVTNDGRIHAYATTPGVYGSSNLLFNGTGMQTLAGSGLYDTLGAITVGADAHVAMQTDLKLYGTSTSSVAGTLDFNNHIITGTGKFQTREAASVTTNVTSSAVGSYTIILDPAAFSSGINTANVAVGMLVSGAGLASDTYIISTSSSASIITVSTPVISPLNQVTISSNAPTLNTFHVNGIDGSVAVTGIKSFGTGTNYIYNTPTLNPFPVSSNNILGNVSFLAPATSNKSVSIGGVLRLQNGHFTIRASDTIRMRTSADIDGAPFSDAKHIVTQTSGGMVGKFRMDSILTPKLLPIGTGTNYLPATLDFASHTNVYASVYEGMTQDGTLSGTLLAQSDRDKVVNAVWDITRSTGATIGNLQLSWNQALEGAVFSGLADGQIGLIQNTSGSWGQPSGTAVNTNNTASLIGFSFGTFGVGSGASTPVNTFIFSPIADKIYGNADFTVVATSSNTTQPISYASSNTAVATITPAGILHITGAGTTNITASQSTDGTYPDTSVTRTFLVQTAPLTITANSFTRFEGVANPTLTASYSGFVHAEDASVLQTPPVLTTTATLSSSPGTYPITVTGASAANYQISYIDGALTVVAVSGTFSFDPIPVKTYGDVDFTQTAISQNTTQPIIYTSSNSSVATVNSVGLIHIVGAGTTDITASQATDGTLPSASVTRTCTVNPATLVITADNATRTEGVANPVFTATYSGFVNDENSTVLSTPVSISTTATLTSPAGTYPINPSGAVAANYTITYVAGTLTITPAPVTGPVTYYWVGGTGAMNTPLSFSGSSRWNTAQDGSGISRPSTDSLGILIVDGSNIGGAMPTTGTIYANTGSTRMGQLILRNGAEMILSRITTGGGTITIKGDSTTNHDLVIENGSSLTLTSADSVAATSGNNLLITSNATGKISGTFTLGGGTCRVTVSNPQAGGALFFDQGSVCNTNTQINYYPFGSSAGVNKGVIFKNGSKLVYKGGKSFFRASSSSIIPIVFQPGSTCRFEANVPNAFSDSSLFFSNRNFANVEIGTGVSVHADDFYNIDNLTIENSADFALRGTSSSPLSGNIINNGTFGCIPGFTSSTLLMKGSAPQTISGSGLFNPLGALNVAAGADVLLQASLTLNGTSTSIIHGKLNLSSYTLTGTGNIQTRADGQINTSTSGVTSGTRILVLPSLTGISVGMSVSGAGIPPHTCIVGTSSTAGSITLSDSATATVTDIQITGSIPQIRTAHPDGVDGSLGGMNILNLASATDYIYDGPTVTPFSLRSVTSVRNLTLNAPVTSNRTLVIDSVLSLNNAILTIRPSDTIIINNGLAIGGTQSVGSYIHTAHDAFNAGVLRVNNMNASMNLPIGSATHYLPVSMVPTANSSVTASVYEGVTTTGELNATALTPAQLQTLVNAVWKLNRLTGTGNISLELNWDASLEGSQFALANNALMGMIQNSSGVWGAPFGNGDNTTNTVSSVVTSLGYFSVGAVTNASPFVFNTLPDKTYGDADFNTSIATMNTSQPVEYSSSNSNVATVSASGLIHIVGSGTADITASQNTDGFYPAASITRTLTVNKASLIIAADNKSKFQGAANPTLTYSISGFVLGETESVLLTPVDISTTATTTSSAGAYPITVTGATATHYNITFVAGILNVLSQLSFMPLADKTYGNPDFIAIVSSMNTTQPILYSSSNTNVATISSTGVIHIVGAGACDIIVSQAAAGVFPDITVTRSLTVNKAPLIISVADTTKNEGAENPAFRFIYNGFVLGETEAQLSAIPVPSTLATVQSVPGVYAVMPEGASSSNYSFIYRSGKLTVYPTDISALSFHVYYADGGLNVRIYSPLPDLVDILLFDKQGHFISRKNMYAINGLTSSRIELGQLASGIYAVAYRGKHTQQTKWVRIVR